MLNDFISVCRAVTYKRHAQIYSSNKVNRNPYISLKRSANDHPPAMFPRAQTACSLIWACGEEMRPMKAGTAPPWTTALVWSDVPDAMLVRAQAASNCMGGDSTKPRKLTNLGIRPALMIWSIGGCLSLDSNFLDFNWTNRSL